ncbi:MAG: hypothetical protein FWF51_12360 [Chitinivibrionia bacterium]|nr:hypothetical protein [Chitinivibrionia bacterium]
MKKLDLIKSFSAVFVVAAWVSAQDLITMRDGSEVQAVIVEVGLDAIKYKKYNYQDGPFFTVNVSEVFSIKYRNGEKDVFETKENSTALTSQYPLYYPVYVPQNTPMSIMPTQTTNQSYSTKTGRSKIVWGNILMWTGISLLGTGIPFTAEISEDFAAFIINGGTMLAVGIPILASGVKDKRNYKNNYSALLPDKLQISSNKLEFIWAF